MARVTTLQPGATPAAKVEMHWICNICGASCEPGHWQRVSCSNPDCNSTARTRAVIHVLSHALFGESLPISDFPERPDLRGIGMSDWGYDWRLAEKLGYQNTFYDEEPRLDITAPPQELLETLDFVISSDVFEHVPPPVQRAFDGAVSLLRPGGVFVLTVPYSAEGETREHFPNLAEWEIVQFKGARILVNHTATGEWEVYDDLHFHGGPGLTLEMRHFSRPDLIRRMREAGFDEVTDWHDAPEFEPWRERHGLPIVARR
jgi:SAM-dependent methyltransferase